MGEPGASSRRRARRRSTSRRLTSGWTFERSAARGSLCEWKGRATYFDIVVGEWRSEAAAWTYLDPTPRFRDLAGALCFYPSRVDECLLGDEPVAPQPGRFYGGWMTVEIIGPVKGEPGTLGW